MVGFRTLSGLDLFLVRKDLRDLCLSPNYFVRAELKFLHSCPDCFQKPG